VPESDDRGRPGDTRLVATHERSSLVPPAVVGSHPYDALGPPIVPGPSSGGGGRSMGARAGLSPSASGWRRGARWRRRRAPTPRRVATCRPGPPSPFTGRAPCPWSNDRRAARSVLRPTTTVLRSDRLAPAACPDPMALAEATEWGADTGTAGGVAGNFSAVGAALATPGPLSVGHILAGHGWVGGATPLVTVPVAVPAGAIDGLRDLPPFVGPRRHRPRHPGRRGARPVRDDPSVRRRRREDEAATDRLDPVEPARRPRPSARLVADGPRRRWAPDRPRPPGGTTIRGGRGSPTPFSPPPRRRPGCSPRGGTGPVA
jgi:hypothetical protein